MVSKYPKRFPRYLLWSLVPLRGCRRTLTPALMVVREVLEVVVISLEHISEPRVVVSVPPSRVGLRTAGLGRLGWVWFAWSGRPRLGCWGWAEVGMG